MLKTWWSNLRPNFVLIMRPVHWKWRLMSLMNIFGSFFVYTMVWTVAVVGIGSIVPEIYGPSVGFHRLLSWYLAVQVVGNSILFLSTNTDLRRLTDTKKTDEEWLLYCQTCRSKIPPRGHHCALCNKCVLKRDHHCFFVSCCIGFYNQKYFFMFLVYACFSTCYAFYLMPYFLASKYDIEFTSVTNYFTLLPSTLYVHLFVHEVSIYVLFYVTLMYASLSCAFFTGSLVGFQAFLILRGQTTYELIYGARDYDEGAWENFLDCFGRYWYVTLVLPLPLPQRHLGIYKSMMSYSTDPSIKYRYDLITSMSI
ncbi:uncharacterized protein LOC141903835 [Tubulanus polymorphus]|uniref:uncharacterized protein LOC141903835 n=1 Tax=Tubulanus polymorphus TaxID=672921 RepID=UPI003DA348C1